MFISSFDVKWAMAAYRNGGCAMSCEKNKKLILVTWFKRCLIIQARDGPA